MSNSLSLTSILHPQSAFRQLSQSELSPAAVLWTYAIWLMLLPPTFAWVGAYVFGWRLGAEEPLILAPKTLTIISAAYFLTLVFGFLSTAVISRWMASTYGAEKSLGHHFALVAIVGTPLALASAAHLFPHVFFNVLVLIPTMIWSMSLLYKGIPIILNTPPERGMLMASALVGWLLVAAVSLLGISMALWTTGIGPRLGV